MTDRIRTAPRRRPAAPGSRGPSEILLPRYLTDPLLRVVNANRQLIVDDPTIDVTTDRVPTALPPGNAITRPGTTTVLRNRTNEDGDLVSEKVPVPVIRTLSIARGVVSLAVTRLAEDPPLLEGTWFTYNIGSDKTNVDSDAGDMTYPRDFQTRPEVNGQQTSAFQSDVAHHLGDLANILEAEVAAGAPAAPAAQQRSVVAFPSWVKLGS